MFEQLEPENQQKLTDVFEGEVDFSNDTSFPFWLGENEDESEFLAEKMDKFKEVMA